MSTAQLALDLGHRAAMGREDFLVAASNEEAVAWLDRWPDWPAPALVIHGPAGSGKTHLAQVWQARVAAAGGTAPLVAVDALTATPPVETLARARACVIEGADWWLPDAAVEAALFHLYNHLASIGGHVLITGRRPPGRWDFALADLRSRLTAAPAVAIGAPDDALIAAVLVKHFADRQLRVGQEVVDYLLPRMERSFAATRDVVARLDRLALADRRNITVPLAREALGATQQEKLARKEG